MGKLVANFFISLDGVVEAPNEWHFPYFDEAMGAVMQTGMQAQGAFLLGRQLYDEWSDYWPANPDEDFGRHINALPKYVVSSTLTDPQWEGTTLIPGSEAVAGVRAAKEATDGDLAMSGCATTVRWLLAEGLLDELHLLVHPIAVGHGQRLFQDTPTHPLTLLRSQTLPSGVLSLVYAPATR